MKHFMRVFGWLAVVSTIACSPISGSQAATKSMKEISKFYASVSLDRAHTSFVRAGLASNPLSAVSNVGPSGGTVGGIVIPPLTVGWTWAHDGGPDGLVAFGEQSGKNFTADLIFVESPHIGDSSVAAKGKVSPSGFDLAFSFRSDALLFVPTTSAMADISLPDIAQYFQKPEMSKLGQLRVLYRNDSPWADAWQTGLSGATQTTPETIAKVFKTHGEGFSSYDEIATALQSPECKDRCVAFGLRGVDAKALKLLKLDGRLPGQSKYPLTLETNVFVKQNSPTATEHLIEVMESQQSGASNDFVTLKRQLVAP